MSDNTQNSGNTQNRIFSAAAGAFATAAGLACVLGPVPAASLAVAAVPFLIISSTLAEVQFKPKIKPVSFLAGAFATAGLVFGMNSYGAHTIESAQLTPAPVAPVKPL